MKMINRLIAIALCVALIITTLPADASALRPVAHKNYCAQPEKITQQLQSISLSAKQKNKERASIILRRAREVYRPLLCPLLILPVVLLLSHIICEYHIESSNPLSVGIDDPNLEEEAMLFFEGLKDNFLTGIKILLQGQDSSTPVLHYLPSDEIKRRLFQHIAMLLLHVWLLWLYYPTKRIMTKWLILVATVCYIYGASLSTFDIAKYHGILDYIYIHSIEWVRPRWTCPSDLFYRIYVPCFCLAAIGMIRHCIFLIKNISYENKHGSSAPDIEKNKSDSNKDPLGEDLMTDSHDGNDGAVSMPTHVQEASLPEAYLLSHGLHTKVFIFDSAA